jgi:A/G-specific adenine glycosylase
MLQQTRVETVVPYFEKWMRLFPNIRALANASEHDVLNAWEGLGYYSRARNLHRAAQIVAEQYNGKLPRDLDALRNLPGIGRYTLGAISSIAFGMDVAALDGNIKRVYSRIFNVSEPVDSTVGEKILWDLAEANLPKGEAGDYNQALMDLGATICLPKNPRCLICPLMKICKARLNGTQNQRPVMKPKKEVPHFMHAAAVIIGDIGKTRNKVLLAQRPAQGLLAGMWEFPNGRVSGDPANGLAKALKAGYNLTGRAIRNKEALATVQHAYSHFKVTVHAFLCELQSAPQNEKLQWIPVKELDDYPMGKIDRQIAKMIAKIRRN